MTMKPQRLMISAIDFPPLDASRRSPRHGSAPGVPGETEVTKQQKRGS